ncbi:S-isoprenylcysteine methyltransferase-like protein [Melioribacter roseus P3M-2]|uniref:S-isoprenylcysteine methyltransferase-like protein n=1 Tax=Melioribacter roseus (strain DSM 23840 / JCM 17771 / VKM B-2668 / P3M-2) TaxID=1191523 RepID=I6YWX1_MELRP|nr:isoprenylcysteine carboxylmethyltransferase family protein [Melioribacter roseus]AFN75072.1 S-isoprenylcysteine methyltransferase-like protein [Melioribacter roseus P3M-2]
MSNFATKIFKYRSYTPLPFLLLMLIFQEATPASLIVGFIIVLVGEFFRLWGVSYAGSETRTTGGVGGTYLVVSGAFAHVRNPLYFGNLLIYTGIGVMSMALYPYLLVAALAFFIWQYRVIIKEEENYLRNKFGQSYEDYCNEVPRWIPTFSKYKNPGLPQPEFNLKAGLKSERRTLQAISVTVLLLIILYLVTN